jgi:hypothetical protein
MMWRAHLSHLHLTVYRADRTLYKSSSCWWVTIGHGARMRGLLQGWS